MGSKWVAIAGVVLGVVLGGTIASVGILPLLAADAPESPALREAIPGEGVTPGSHGVNSAGETYGQTDDPTYEDAPDLIEAIGTNGIIGYVRASELRQATAPAGSLEEARDGSQALVLPVYLSDGTTRIGEFLAGGSSNE